MFNYGDEKVVLKNKGRNITQGELKSIILPIICALKNDKRLKFVISGDDNFEFIKNCLAGMFAEKELFFVSDSRKMDDFGEDFIKNPEPVKPYEFDFIMPEEEKIFINFYTSGSTGDAKCVRKNLPNAAAETVVMNRL